MRSDKDIADSHLEKQAEMSFGAELPFYYKDTFLRAQTVLDFGCGNAAYLRRLAQHFPDKTFVGLDSSKDAIESAERSGMPDNVTVRCGTLEQTDIEIDILLSRFCLMYVEDRQYVVTWAREHVSAAVVEIDPADSFFTLSPELPIFRSVFSRMEVRAQATGGTRGVATDMRQRWQGGGFQLDWSHNVVVTSEPPFSRERMHHLMILNAELVLGSPLPSDLTEELFEWFLSTGYVQYGIHGAHYVPKPS